MEKKKQPPRRGYLLLMRLHDCIRNVCCRYQPATEISSVQRGHSFCCIIYDIKFDIDFALATQFTKQRGGVHIKYLPHYLFRLWAPKPCHIVLHILSLLRQLIPDPNRGPFPWDRSNEDSWTKDVHHLLFRIKHVFQENTAGRHGRWNVWTNPYKYVSERP